MTYKQNRHIDKASRTNYYKKPLLFSSEDEERLAIQSSRARLMMELVTKPEESHDINHKDVDVNNKTSPHLIHTTYPSLVQSLRWKPYEETCSDDSQNDFPDTYTDCRYHKYKRDHNYDRYTENINRFSFKDNIMTFCDNSTMTRIVTDMCCGAQTPTTSDASITTANVAVKDQSRTQMSQTFYMPVPILKRQDYESNYEKRKVKVLDPQINTCNDYEKLLKSVNNMEPFCCPTNAYANNVNCRRVLYNEGISNMIAENDITQHPLPSHRLVSQSKFNRDVKTNKCVGDKPNIIPFDHKAHSKYHNLCSHPIPDLYKVDDINDLASSNKMKHYHKPIQYTPYSPGIKLPRRVLTSERDVDLYVDKRRSKLKRRKT